MQASAAGAAPLQVSGQGLLQRVSAAGRQTAVSELVGNLPDSAEENPDQKEVSGLEEAPDQLDVTEHWVHLQKDWQQIVGPVQEAGLEAVAAAEMEDFAEDHLQRKTQQ